ncbi:hypothetical protein SAMN05444280_15010 [Tangfeifania diversioriginum]|uniref:Uncharacterized protein n=1 Tax=Tangfeifania diversioriginum TaxID=1168035 RepID=A0A1M6P0Y9_9BACT|nr:hypothetical protein [Tangfeifania diversioriginum]SHK01657.1 hypothetical protein SAMN05444280_15010 [Tangfeifania diversioriginum]
MKSFLPVLLIICSFYSGFCQNKSELVIDETAKKTFSQTELEGIQSMIRFVDSCVVKETNLTDINAAYHAYLERQKEFMKKGEMMSPLIKDAVKFSFLERLDSNAVKSIWHIDDYIKEIGTRDTSLTDVHGIKTISINLFGSYMDYLKKIGETDERYKNIAETVEIAGDISPATTGWFLLNHNEFDFMLFKDRLFATVFILRLGDPFEEKVDRYLESKSNHQ